MYKKLFTISKVSLKFKKSNLLRKEYNKLTDSLIMITNYNVPLQTGCTRHQLLALQTRQDRQQLQ